MEPTNIDPRIYGGQAAPANPAPYIDPLAPAGGAAVQPPEPPAKVPTMGLSVGASVVQDGQQALAEATKPLASLKEVALASVKTWSTTRVLDAINRPAFDVDPEFDPKEFIREAPVALSDDEQKFLAGSKSMAEAQFNLGIVTDQRQARQTQGDRPWVAGLVGVVDPIWIGLDIASMGAASVLTKPLALGRAAGRLGAAGIAGGGAVAIGKVEQTVAPVSDSEIVFNALANGIISGAVYNPRTARLEKIDPDYPQETLQRALAQGTNRQAASEAVIASEAGDLAQFTRTRTSAAAEQALTPVPRKTYADIEPELGGVSQRPGPTAYIKGVADDAALARGGARNLSEPTDAYTILARHEADPEFGPLIQTLRKEHGEQLALVRTREGDVDRAFYAHADGTVYLDKKADAFTALHESIHGLTVSKLEYGKANPGTAHGRLVQELDDIRLMVKDRIDKMPEGFGKARLDRDPNNPGSSYFTKNLEEFVAGLFAGKHDDFARVMANIPVTGSRNALTKMVGVIRKLLGVPPKSESALTKALGITDELMRTKLDVVSRADGSVKSFAPSGTPQQIKQQVAGWWDQQSKKAARGIEWSLNRELRGKGTAGDKVADLLVDDPINMTGNSAVSQRQAIRNELSRHQEAFEDQLKTMMAEQGAGTRQRVLNSAEAYQVQARIEGQLADELARRDNRIRRGLPYDDPNVDPQITALADLHATATSAALGEMKGALVRGAETLQPNAGYFSRKWDITKLEAAEGRFLAVGMTDRQARRAVRDLVSEAVRRADGTIPQDIADDIALAITDRTRRKGYFEDVANQGTMGDDGAQGIRSLLAGSGISQQRMQRIEEFMTGRKDDAGQLNALKDRVPMDLTAAVQLPDGTNLRMMDLIDTNITRNLDGYLDDAAGQAGLARKGLVDNSDIVALRKEFLDGIGSEAERRIAADLFDNTIKAIKGQPVGEEMGKYMRRLQAITTSVGLANSGMWQLMEFANVAAKYGLTKTMNQMMTRMPLIKQLMGTAAGSVDEAGSLAHVLSHNSRVDLRIRPFVSKLEDNFVIPADDRITLALQQAKQLVPYINGMKFVHHAQANMTANLITDLVRRGAKGDAKAREALARYGLEGHQLDNLKLDIDTHGMTVDKWSDGAWADVRGPLNKMMDDAVLRNRTGELPSFAQFSTLGKFIFTFRSFVLGAHNKVLAGTMGRHGMAGLGLLMAYQFPLAMLTTYAVGAARGKPENDMSKLASSAVTQQSAVGLFGELWGILSGDKQQFGSSGLMAIDRLYKVGSQAGQGNFGNAAFTAAQTVPLLAIMPGIKALAEQAKE